MNTSSPEIGINELKRLAPSATYERDSIIKYRRSHNLYGSRREYESWRIINLQPIIPTIVEVYH
jgi:hypothetical protein